MEHRIVDNGLCRLSLAHLAPVDSGIALYKYQIVKASRNLVLFLIRLIALLYSFHIDHIRLQYSVISLDIVSVGCVHHKHPLHTAICVVLKLILASGHGAVLVGRALALL